MLSRLSDKTIDARLVQYSNALFPMLVTLSDMTTDSRLAQS